MAVTRSNKRTKASRQSRKAPNRPAIKKKVGSSPNITKKERPRRYQCLYIGCDRDFDQRYKVGRHRWTHIPEEHLPCCPGIDGDGKPCRTRFTGRKDNFEDHWSRLHKGQAKPEDFKWSSWCEVMRDYEAAKKSEGGRTTQPIIGNLASAGSDLPSDHYTGASIHLTSTKVETWAPSEPAFAVDSVPVLSQDNCQILLDMFQDLFPLPDGTLLF